VSIRDAALLAAGRKLGKDLVCDAYNASRVEVCDLMLEEGIQQVHAKIGDERVGSISVTKPSVKASVANRAIFIEWVKANVPGVVTIETREVVNPAWETVFVGHLLPYKDGAATADGEEVPGVTFTMGEPFVTVRQTPDERRAILDALRSGALDAKAMLALPEGDDAA
jgi:hypothetical protein